MKFQSNTMEAIVVTGAGQYEYSSNVPIPEPAAGEVRIRVLAAGICGTDVHITRGDESLMSMITPPVTLGHEFCGEVDKCGPDVVGLKSGEYVTAEMHIVCNECPACHDGKFHACEKTKICGIHSNGAFAEFVVVPASNIVKLPKKIPVKVAAVMDALGNAIHTACKVDVKGKSVAIIGYGPIGAMAAEVVRFCGASRILIIDVSAGALMRAKAWCDKTHSTDKITLIDAKEADPLTSVTKILPGGCDVSLEFSGASSGINTALAITRAGGDVSLLGIPKEADVTIKNYGRNVIFKGLTLHGVIGREMFDTWNKMIELIEAGLDVSNIVTGEFPLRKFSEGLERFKNGLEQKVVLYPGKQDK